ncbi:efflux RND transporter periplasmic adaptor subunit [Mesorhizobium sp. SB112]|uniref:efflux RND transporter periplasmic adaptor subunit n=1 Tax=Mesorhizobium sp. SB112 TaxID=3151853 RepID=UPI00326528D9
MSGFRFHKVAALTVLVAFAIWMGTGEFSSVGSAASENDAKQEATEQPKPPVRTVAVITPPRTNHARAIRISGQTEADKRAVLASRTGGIIAELPAKQGERIKAGELVLMLDAEEKQSIVENTKQLLKQREAEAAAADKLSKSGNLAKLTADNAQAALTTARSQFDTAQAELARNRVVAPFDGVVDRVAVELGSSVMAGAEVATILKLDPIIAKGEISERDLRYLKLGDEADVRLVDGDIVKGRLSYISRDASSSTRTFRIEVAIPNADDTIPAGMTAEITLRAQPADAVMLPRSVVTLSKNGDLGIRAVDKDSKITFHPIDLVDDTPDGLVLGGIPSDARIVVAGQDLVTEGDTVQAVEADAETLKKLAGAPLIDTTQ